MTTYLIVKSDVSFVDKTEFDDWYENEHLSEALNSFKAISAKRGWVKNSNFHLAIYEFENTKKAEKALKSKKIFSLINKFDSRWDKKVKRNRELIDINQKL